MKINCMACGYDFEVPGGLEGHKYTCPKCFNHNILKLTDIEQGVILDDREGGEGDQGTEI